MLIRVKNSQISDKNKNLIMDFYDDCVSSRSSTNRCLFYVCKLFRIIHLLRKDLDKASEENIKEIIRKVELNGDYTEWTKSNYRVTIKKFYKWLEGGKDYPEKVRWIKTGVKNAQVTPDTVGGIVAPGVGFEPTWPREATSYSASSCSTSPGLLHT
jgi:integrase/recombinase XerD